MVAARLKAETRLHGAPAVLDGTPAVQVRKGTRSSGHSRYLSTPKRLIFQINEPLAIAQLLQFRAASVKVGLLACLWLGVSWRPHVFSTPSPKASRPVTR